MVKQIPIFFITVLILLIRNAAVFAEIRLPAIISNNMVLQQKSEVALWGTASPGEKITVTGTWNKGQITTIADASGNWIVRIKTPGAGGPYKLNFSGGNTISIDSVMIGEVWLCSGQSNMNFPLEKQEGWRTGITNGKEEISRADYPTMRMFTVKQNVSTTPISNLKGQWEVCSPKTAGHFSAVAYFFGKVLTDKLKVPVGLIHSSWGGTPAESWTKREALEADPDFQPILERYQTALKEYPAIVKKYETDQQIFLHKQKDSLRNGVTLKAPPKPMHPDSNSKSPMVLYNAMIHPLIPYTVKGVIWYQGESNSVRAFQYRKLFPAMIRNWRRDWNAELPFLFVQIAPHKGQLPEIRESQFLTLKNVPGTGMAVITDAGDSSDIHPRNKEVVGKRLAAWALANQYGKREIVFSGPLYKNMKAEGNKIRLYFDHVNGGFKKEDLIGFTIAGSDQRFLPAKAEIDGNTIVVYNELLRDPIAVRFGWSNFPRTNLYNKAGFPASPFRTDSWKAQTEGDN